jgi:hypothetical protein
MSTLRPRSLAAARRPRGARGGAPWEGRGRATPPALALALALLACGGGEGAPDGGPGGGGGGGGGSGGGGSALCLGSSLLSSLGRSRVMVGFSGDDATASRAPFDLRYVYLAGALPEGAGPCASCAAGCTAAGASCANAAGGCGWWGCWQWDQAAPGQYAVDFAARATGDGEIPMLTYYVLLQASGVAEGAAEVTVAARDPAFMSRYLADWRFLLQRLGTRTVLLHVEPDFWGYAQQAGDDPHALPAAVGSANPTDCGGQADTIAGMGRCMISMVRKYAPNARVGLHASGWGTRWDVLQNRDPAFDVAGHAARLGAFLAACGAGEGDFVAADMSDRDAGTRGNGFDATNGTLPSFHQAFAWAKGVAEAVGRPILWWQIPLGNPSLAPANRDNRVDYLLTHVAEVAAAHGVGLAFGAGAGGQATPTTDGGNFVARSAAYSGAGGEPLCR